MGRKLLLSISVSLPCESKRHCSCTIKINVSGGKNVINTCNVWNVNVQDPFAPSVVISLVIIHIYKVIYSHSCWVKDI